MKKLALLLVAVLMLTNVNNGHASSDAETIASIPTVANIAQVGDIWSASVPTSVQYEKSTVYPCGYVIVPIKGLLPYSTLADKANGVSLNMTAWSDAGAKLGTGYLSSSDWNPVGPISQAKIFFCGADIFGTHTLIIETLYYTSTTGLLSRYLSTTNKSRISISLKRTPPVAIKDFKISLSGQNIDCSWTAPSSDALISGYEIALFDTNNSAPIPPLDSDLKNPVVVSTLGNSIRQTSLAWSEISKSTNYPGTSIVFKIRAISSSFPAPWSNGIYLTQQQFAAYKPASALPPKPNFSAYVSPQISSEIVIQIAGSDIVGYVNNFKVNGFISKIRRVNGQDQIGSIGPISGLTSYTAKWTNSSSGSYEVAVALQNSLGQGEWSDYRLVVVPSQFIETSPTPTPSAIKKKITISCLKGKIVKKVTGLTPKCPTGYKLKI